jgi:5,10-methylenetetrahydromethanopterin reductase
VTEFWFQATPAAAFVERLVASAEVNGWDGVQIADGRSGDVFVALTLAARATRRLKLSTGVVNPVVRHPAVLASAIAGIERQAPGRVVLGLGRGDSSVRLLNLRAATVAQFGSAARDIQAFLRGERAGDGGPHVPWLAASPGNKVPLDIYATGPRMIALAGEAAERTTLAVGAEADRIKWGTGLVRASAGGGDRFVGAAVALGADPARRRAIDLARGPLSVMTHFRAGSVHSGGHLPETEAAMIRSVASSYDYSRHGNSDSAQARLLDDEFVTRAAVAGTPAECAERITELAGLGVGRIAFLIGLGGAQPSALVDEQALIAQEVLSLVRLPDRGGNAGVTGSGVRSCQRNGEEECAR